MLLIYLHLTNYNGWSLVKGSKIYHIPALGLPHDLYHAPTMHFPQTAATSDSLTFQIFAKCYPHSEAFLDYPV